MAISSVCRGYLISIKNSGDNGSYIPIINETCYIGRGPECDVRLKDENINEKHCLIKISTHKKVTIHNLCPENPVLLNNKPLGANEEVINHGDLIQIIDNTFKWENAEPSSANNVESRNSFHISQNTVLETVDMKRYSAPELVYEIDRENIDPGPQPEIITTPKTSPDSNSHLNSPNVKKLTSSCTINRSSTVKHEIKRACNTCTKDMNQIRRSRLFSKTFKAMMPETNTSVKEKAATMPRVSHAKVSATSKEINKTPSKEVKSRYELNRSSIRKSITSSFRKDVQIDMHRSEINEKQNLEETVPDNCVSETYEVSQRNEKHDMIQKENTCVENEDITIPRVARHKN